MKRFTRKILIIILAVVFVAAGIRLGIQGYQYWQAEKEYDEARDLAGMEEPLPTETPIHMTEDTVIITEEPAEVLPTPTPDPVAETLAKTDFSALNEINADVIGWIEIPNTVLSYPIMQGEDNDYYLNHTWKGAASAIGSIYMDYRNDPAMNDFNTIIYGHRMGDGTMFNSLHDYRDQAHWEVNPVIYIATNDGVRCYKIFAAYEADAVKKHTYRLGLTEKEGQQAYIDYCTARSVIETGIVPEPGDHILTLSTCVSAGSGYETRWVVQAVYQNVGEGA